jgi:1,4-dihydroxy-6-naphthoate synthase
MRVTVGHTPDADDAFMFYAIVSNKVKMDNVSVEHIIEDIESLNRRALNGDLDVTAISAHAYAYTKNYVILRSGGSFGKSYGPIVIAKKKLSVNELKKKRIAIPGKMTTAYLLLRMAIGGFESVEMKFSEINSAVEKGMVDAGLVIHEAQITYDQAKFVNALDLGLWWDDATKGLPLPLGINVASTRLGNEGIRRFDELLKHSIQYAYSNIDDALDYAMQYARGASRYMIEKFVKMYVNDVTLDMGESGVRALQKLYSVAGQKGIIGNIDIRIA